MTLTLYLTIQLIIMSAILALGCNLIFSPIAKKLRGSRMHRSGQMIGLSMTILPITSYIYCIFNMKTLGALYATAVNLTAYAITSTLVSLAYYMLLEQAKNKTFVRVHLILGFLYPIPLWVGLLFGSEFIANHIIVTSYTIFCVMAVVHISTCLYFYIQRYTKQEAKLSEIEQIESRLIGRTIYVSMVMILIATFSAAFFSYPIWLGLIFIALFVAGVVYIYSCYHRILHSNINSMIPLLEEEVEEVVEAEDVEEELQLSPLSDEVKQHIEKYLQNWIEKREFLKQTTSINSVAQALCTNRTYLSRYINSVYHCSFKTWITQLRVEESKRLMVEQPERSISDIAIETGFTSVTSFSHIFTRKEHLTPSRWRDAHLR